LKEKQGRLRLKTELEVDLVHGIVLLVVGDYARIATVFRIVNQEQFERQGNPTPAVAAHNAGKEGIQLVRVLAVAVGRRDANIAALVHGNKPGFRLKVGVAKDFGCIVLKSGLGGRVGQGLVECTFPIQFVDLLLPVGIGASQFSQRDQFDPPAFYCAPVQASITARLAPHFLRIGKLFSVLPEARKSQGDKRMTRKGETR
jgi:hypothetical protein